jgi:ABC-type phosphate/phosphonate transport system substrate-binding protein
VPASFTVHERPGGSELDAIRAVLDGRADAAAIGSSTWEAIGREELMPGALQAFWTSPPYCLKGVIIRPTVLTCGFKVGCGGQPDLRLLRRSWR